MIRPPGVRGAAFGDASDGNGRDDPRARAQISARLGLPAEWGFVRQVHGAQVRWVTQPGPAGDGDAMVTPTPMLPIAVATADCFPIVLEAPDLVGIAHAGWRGAAAGVVSAVRARMTSAGSAPVRAAVGPGIGPCCFEVGPDVAARFPGHTAATSWGSTSVDLPAVLARELDDLDVWWGSGCTRCDDAYHSFRRDATPQRQVTVAWLPSS